MLVIGRCFGLVVFAGLLPLWVVSCGQASQLTTVSVAADVPPLVRATLRADATAVEQLLQNQSDPNVVYRTNTALTYAARDGYLDIARLLVAHGADVNWIDGEGVTPLILASFKDHQEIVQLLLDHGADITVQDQWHRTALDYALRRGPADPIVQLLQAHQ
ncbi:ankyrin repeat domain-containing protein [Leptothoe kymatousa]|uniref:Ankyrin repeat domain-containing protein n=1 Tax=Leptothoe kymatousa TAU-MAC 1615 TaxID=2364775 RepID=A0ABS5Y6Y5_9CYAN|nr:ankyrin repeat domain-containing protein [Leptothoe kymatousa]MBT9313602.1 ankyrin repeat domain-containing protein [Leptothoe kymatousa TAU-MAC 1615]